MYQKIYDEILSNILNGKYKVGFVLPSEAEFEKIFSVSRTPVREALKQLSNDGYITRSKGKQSVVSSIYPKGRWTLMTGLQQYYSDEDWKRITAETLEVKTIEHPEYAKQLELFLNSEVTYLKRMRYFNGKPVVYLEHYITPRIPIEIFEENNNAIAITEIIRKETGIKTVKALEELESVLVTPELAQYLNVDTNTPILKVKRVSYSKEGWPIDINIYYVRTDTWKYSVSYKLD